MLKKIARMILRKEIDTLTKISNDNEEALSVLLKEERKITASLREALDEKLKLREYTPVSTVSDLQLSSDELKLYKELGDNPVYISLTDKMATRVVLITSQQREITKEQMDRVNGVREGICQIVWDIQNEKSKQEKANPLTGEVTSK